MKKVLVLTIVVTLLAASAFAGVRNTKHDLSSGLSGNTNPGTIKSTNYNEVCVFCHTPHGGQTGGLAPLWNRSAAFNVYAAGDLYNSVTLETASKPGAVVNAVNASDAKLCMSCHDGTTLDDGLYNPANSSANAQPVFPGTDNAVSANANLGSDLTDDHPIGMNYDLVQSTDGPALSPGLVASNGSTPNYVGDPAVLLYDYAGNDVMWCSSCHDVHDNTYSPFLNISNVGSALCTNCHNK
jgi:predicted CXXCH cytochrome family protein